MQQYPKILEHTKYFYRENKLYLMCRYYSLGEYFIFIIIITSSL